MENFEILSSPFFIIFYGFFGYCFLRNSFLCGGFFIQRVLFTKNIEFFEIWELFKLLPSLKEKIAVGFFFLSFGISNKIMINHKLNVSTLLITFFFLQLIAIIFPIFYFVILDYILVALQSFLYAFFYEKSTFCNNFINLYVFPTASFRTKLILFVFGNPFKKALGSIIGAGGISIAGQRLLGHEWASEGKKIEDRAMERTRFAIEQSQLGKNPITLTPIHCDSVLQQFKAEGRRDFEEVPLRATVEYIKDFSKNFFS